MIITLVIYGVMAVVGLLLGILTKNIFLIGNLLHNLFIIVLFYALIGIVLTVLFYYELKDDFEIEYKNVAWIKNAFKNKVFIAAFAVALIILSLIPAPFKNDRSVKSSQNNETEDLLQTDEMADLADTYVPKEPELTMMVNVEGSKLSDAIVKLQGEGFTNIDYNANDGNLISDTDKWVVESQNIESGSKIDKNEKIVLLCRVEDFSLYLDIKSEASILFSKYDISVLLDDVEIGTFENGDYYTFLTRVTPGSHKVTFCNISDSSTNAEKTFDVNGDCTLSAKLASNSSSIDMKEYALTEGVAAASIEMKNVTGKTLDKGHDELTKSGFVNITTKAVDNSSIWDESNWVIVSQNIPEGNSTDKNENIELSCEKASVYLKKYIQKTPSESETIAKNDNNDIKFVNYLSKADMNSELSKMEEKEKADWIVKSADVRDGTMNMYLVYKGYVEVPDLKDMTLSDAIKLMHEKGFSAVEGVSEDKDDSYVSDYYTVVSQSVAAGKKVNANGKITLGCIDKEKEEIEKAIEEEYNSEKPEENGSETDTELNKYIGKQVSELMPYLEEKGYTAIYLSENMDSDFTYPINNEKGYKEMFIVRSFKDVNPDKKTLTVYILSKEMIDEQEKKESDSNSLSSKLPAMDAWYAVEDYGIDKYPYGFKLHYLKGKLAETAEDDSTWFLKAYCDVTNEYGVKEKKLNCEARVTGTRDNPKVIYFMVY